MTEELSGQQAQGQASPEPQTASATPQEPQSQEQKPLDEARVIELATQIASRTAQSLVDKAEYRISQKAQAQIQALDLNKSTLGLSDQQVQDAKQKIVMDDLTATQQEQPASQSPEFEGQPQADSVTEAQYIQGLFKGTESGTEVTPNDPEWTEWQKVYQDNFNDPSMQAASRVILATNKAAAAKAQRLKTNTDTAAARVMQGGSTSGAGDESGLDGHELFQRAHRK